MSQYVCLYTLHERWVDADGDEIDYFERNLPHGDFMIEKMSNAWNDFAPEMLKIMNHDLHDKIDSTHAVKYHGNPEDSTIKFVVKLKPGVRLSGRFRSEIDDFMDSQFSDGWGEGFFGIPMTAPDGKRICPE